MQTQDEFWHHLRCSIGTGRRIDTTWREQALAASSPTSAEGGGL
ncbi:hypothetical protein [Actinoplanes sp. G11-F43]